LDNGDKIFKRTWSSSTEWTKQHDAEKIDIYTWI